MTATSLISLLTASLFLASCAGMDHCIFACGSGLSSEMLGHWDLAWLGRGDGLEAVEERTSLFIEPGKITEAVPVFGSREDCQELNIYTELRIEGEVVKPAFHQRAYTKACGFAEDKVVLKDPLPFSLSMGSEDVLRWGQVLGEGSLYRAFKRID